jgi:O-antigen/teichoic acid export membrane protein
MPKSNRSFEFGRNIAANWSAFLFAAAVSFFLSPFIVRNLGNEAYGLWVLLGSLVGYLGLLDFGVRGAVTRYIAQHHARDDSQESTRVVSASILLFGSFGLVAIFCAGALAVLVPPVFNLPESLVNGARIIILIGGLNVAVALIGGVFGGIVAGLQRFDVGSGIAIFMTATRAGLIILALKSGYGLIALALIQLLSSLAEGGAAWLATRRLYPQLEVRFEGPLRPHMRRLLSFGLFSSLIHISGVLIYYSDTLVIAGFLPIGLVTFFAIAASLCEYARSVISGVSTVIMPRVSALNALGGEKVERAVIGAGRIATLIMAPIVATFWWRGESFINLWMGSEYGATSGEVLRILATVVLLGGARSIAVSTIMGVNQHRFLAPLILLEGVANLILSLILVRFLGLVGVALGTLIPSMIITLGYIPRLLSKSTGVRIITFYRDAWGIPLLACIPFAIGSFLVELHFPANNLAIFFMQVFMLLPLIPVTLLAFLTSVEKNNIFASIRKLIKPNKWVEP